MIIEAGKPHKRSHPGEFIKDFIDELNISQYRLSKETGIPHSSVTRIISGDAGITANTAIRLGLFFGNSPEFWMNVQTQYDLWITEKQVGKELHKSVHPYKVLELRTA